jgi:ParB/RepB/Spo0J family partition protein
MNDAPQMIPIKSLTPHPDNPRVMEREDVIACIEGQLRERGVFDLAHSITARLVNDSYQIVAGHHRVAAAKRAGLKHVPAWVREMDDETAFMQLVMSNAQSELSLLERGMHALAATEKGKHGTSVAAYAKRIGIPQQTVSNWIMAAEVAKVTRQQVTSLLDRTMHLTAIHAAPEHCWKALVERLLNDGWTVSETEEAVAQVRNVKPPRGYERLFKKRVLEEMAAAGRDVEELTKHLVRIIERTYAEIRDVQFKVEEYQGYFAAYLDQEGPWNARAMAADGERILEAQRKEKEEADKKAARLKVAVTLAQWKTLSTDEQRTLLRVRSDKAKLTKQTTDSIEWARWSWNPVTGCLHDCPYCYARDIAQRYYPQKFEPSIVPEQLAASLLGSPPPEAAQDTGYKNIFTCSMADLFGNWVPKEWIEEVLSVVREAKQWNFLFLTKFPQRLREFSFPRNARIGTTVDLQARVANPERAMRQVDAAVKWVSIEPLIEPIKMDFSIFQWVVIGGASASTQTPEWKPPRSWVIDLTARALEAG